MAFLPQNYPRIDDSDSAYEGYLDDSQLVPHQIIIPPDVVKGMILEAIDYAGSKSSREILAIPTGASVAEIQGIYQREGRELFKYFKRYTSDPAASAQQAYGQHYEKIGRELFRNRTLQKERMNSGWRYQHLAVNCARVSGRFRSVSDIGTTEADFNAVIDFIDNQRLPLTLYVSVKNRSDTVGGQDFPKAISALETFARNDKNRRGPYCCVFGITMEKGERNIRRNKQTKQPHSPNVEMWLSDFFWPFFANYSYQELMALMLDVLLSHVEGDELISEISIPPELLSAFGAVCAEAGLIDEQGFFNDPYKLLAFFTE